ncbi:DUF5134 domain-containing protein [Streptomyces sp. NPDC007901]|uniref:DUF5134 domain-containing protein n=1 Tax=Streptomyces sp. NPDC007901 TaxID=3364785 RepID=UPI0036E790C3
MSATDVVYSGLTALFAAAAVRALRHALTSRRCGWCSRVDHLLHTVMALAMTVLPWHSGHALPELPQTASAFFAAAALWFPLTAGRGRRSRLTVIARRLPYSVGMAAMAWMTLAMAGPSHEPPAEGLSSGHGAARGRTRCPRCAAFRMPQPCPPAQEGPTAISGTARRPGERSSCCSYTPDRRRHVRRASRRSGWGRGGRPGR